MLGHPLAPAQDSSRDDRPPRMTHVPQGVQVHLPKPCCPPKCLGPPLAPMSVCLPGGLGNSSLFYCRFCVFSLCVYECMYVGKQVSKHECCDVCCDVSCVVCMYVLMHVCLYVVMYGCMCDFYMVYFRASQQMVSDSGLSSFLLSRHSLVHSCLAWFPDPMACLPSPRGSSCSAVEGP